MACTAGAEQSCTECRMCRNKTAGNETNAERIRKMNDEELAESRIDPIHHYCRSENQMWIGDFYGIADSKKEALQMELEWLKGHEI